MQATVFAKECGPMHLVARDASGREYPRQGSNKPSGSRGKPQKERPPGANSGTAKRGRSAGLKKAAKKAKPVKKAKPAKKAKRAAGRKGGAR
jgi:hypothetical protein